MQWIIRTLILIICCLTWATSNLEYDASLKVADVEIIDQASLNGKYVNLLHVIEAPEDKIAYGAFYEWGYWHGDEYAGYTNLNPGFWVYVYPKWYIWEKISVENNIDPKASAHGKYTALLHVLKVPEDAKHYGNFYDWGFSEEYSYAGYDNLTPGYWVYLAPNWYVWAETNDISGGT